MRLYFLCLLIPLLTAGCSLVRPPEPQQLPPATDTETAVDLDDLSRRAFRQGIEEFSSGNSEILQQLATAEPHTVWGLAATRILQLNDLNLGQRIKIKELQGQVAGLKKDLKKQRKSSDRKSQELKTQNQTLQNKLDELARVLVDLEKHAR